MSCRVQFKFAFRLGGMKEKSTEVGEAYDCNFSVYKKCNLP